MTWVNGDCFLLSHSARFLFDAVIEWRDSKPAAIDALRRDEGAGEK